MQNVHYLFTSIVLLFLTSCGPKEVEKNCTGKIQKQYSSGNISATYEDGCAIKFEKENEYKFTGKVSLKISGDSINPVMKVIHLDRGKILSSNGGFIIESSVSQVKVRLIEGEGTFDLKNKQVTLEKNKVLNIGG